MKKLYLNFIVPGHVLAQPRTLAPIARRLCQHMETLQ